MGREQLGGEDGVIHRYGGFTLNHMKMIYAHLSQSCKRT